MVHWETVDGRSMPRLVGGHLALDLCNTYAGWDSPEPRPRGDWLPDPEAMLVWAVHASAVPPVIGRELRATAIARPAKARAALKRVRSLRTDVHDALVHDDQAAFGRVAEAAQQAARAARLVRHASGAASWDLPPDVGLDVPFLRLAAAAAGLLTSDSSAKVRVCPGEDCGWLFLDRRGLRRWCSMQTCGNTAKAKAFASRRGEAG